jgi:hypothetical protein
MHTKSIPALSPLQLERFWDKVEVHHPAGCWEWTGYTVPLGYGSVRLGDILYQTHRVAYTILIGPIPEGLTIDHLCRNRRCVNPDHLEPVPARVNVLRSFGPAGLKARQTQCIRGHAFDDANTHFNATSGARVCVICAKEYRRLRYLEKRSLRASKTLP